MSGRGHTVKTGSQRELARSVIITTVMGASENYSIPSKVSTPVTSTAPIRPPFLKIP